MKYLLLLMCCACCALSAAPLESTISFSPGTPPYSPYEAASWFQLHQPGGAGGPYTIYDIPGGRVGEQYFGKFAVNPSQSTWNGYGIDLDCDILTGAGAGYPMDWTTIAPQPSHPPGLNFITGTGDLSGIPTQAGTYIMDVQITATYFNGATQPIDQGRRLYRIEILPASGGGNGGTSSGGDDGGGGCVTSADDPGLGSQIICFGLVFGGLAVAFRVYCKNYEARDRRLERERQQELELINQVDTLWSERQQQ